MVSQAQAPFEERGIGWDLHGLPVPAEIILYTKTEFERLISQESRFAKVLKNEVVWVYCRTGRHP